MKIKEFGTRLWSSNRFIQIFVPVIAAIFGLICAGVIMLLSGHSPSVGFPALFSGMFGSPQAIGEALRTATPLILAGLSVAFAYKTGLFNIGVEGQLLVGWLASVWVGYAFELPLFVHIPFAILAAAVAGAIWGAIPGLLKAYYGVNEVIVTIMMNYIGLYTTAYVIRTFLFAGSEKTHNIQETASLHSEMLTMLTSGSRLHTGFFIAIGCCILVWFLLQKTTFGYELRASGYSRNASLYAGMNVKTNIVLSMVFAGGLAGIAGAMEGLGTFGYMPIASAFSGIGFNGIAVALLGANHPFGIIVSSILFGGLQSAAPTMNFQTGIPGELINIMIALIIFFFFFCGILQYWIRKMRKGGKA